jgi:ParB-like chromosome segregation protein Spo0J
VLSPKLATSSLMLQIHQVKIETIYIPTERRKTLDASKAARLAEDILENGMTIPIQVRFDGKRHVLIEGLHRLEAARLLGETTVAAYLVHARKH